MAEISLTDNQDTSFKPLSIRRFWNESTVATGESTLGEECAHISLRPGGPQPRQRLYKVHSEVSRGGGGSAGAFIADSLDL